MFFNVYILLIQITFKAQNPDDFELTNVDCVSISL